MTDEPSSAGAAQAGSSRKVEYALGHSDRERERLMRQGAILRPFLEAAFRAANIGPGMRVLDIGSGAGDAALLAAELVGPTGSVVGLDRDAGSVAWASRRVAEAGHTNIQFRATEFNAYSDSRPFDALVGRFILVHLPDPTATLRHLAQLLRSGAKIVFFEPDFTVPSAVFPSMPDLKNCENWILEALRHSGATLDIGMRLYHIYRGAGFVDASTVVSHLSGCGVSRQMVDFFVETVRSLLQVIERYGIATREEIQIDALGDRMEAAVRAADPQWVGSRYIAAWARKP